MSRQCQAIVLCFECFGAFALFGGTRTEPLLCSALPSDWVEGSAVVGVCVKEKDREGGGANKSTYLI